jgi:hypothetical protein
MFSWRDYVGPFLWGLAGIAFMMSLALYGKDYYGAGTITVLLAPLLWWSGCAILRNKEVERDED